MLTWKSRFVAIPMKNQCKSMNFHVLEGQKITKKTIKKQQKHQYKIEVRSATIFLRFGPILEAKLGPKIDKKSIQKGIKNPIKTRTAHG